MNFFIRFITIAVLLALFTNSMCLSQIINGFGSLRLGKTENEIIRDLNIDQKKIIDGSLVKLKSLYSKKASNSLVKIKYNPSSVLVKDILRKKKSLHSVDLELKKLGVHKCEDAILYIMPWAFNVNNVPIYNLKLLFYKDRLVKIFINCSDSECNIEFRVNFEHKNGSPKVEYYSKDNNCGEKDRIKTSHWPSGSSDIAIQSNESSWCHMDDTWGDIYSSNSYSFSIENIRFMGLLDKCLGK